ncbi:MAG: ankyrin repeat domain-containing protein [Puniceicoccales bacterium]|jgi:hypothetical protein|nr:ankyrin repeat domain-containing protein [Puniceicoccales bacterium]
MKENRLRIQLLFFIIFVSPFSWGSSPDPVAFTDVESVNDLLKTFKEDVSKFMEIIKNSPKISIKGKIEIDFENFSIEDSTEIIFSVDENGQKNQIFSSVIFEFQGTSNGNEAHSQPNDNKESGEGMQLSSPVNISLPHKETANVNVQVEQQTVQQAANVGEQVEQQTVQQATNVNVQVEQQIVQQAANDNVQVEQQTLQQATNANIQRTQIVQQAANAALFNALKGLHCPGTLEEIKKALKNGADVNAEDTNKRTPLIVAAVKDYSDAVEVLLKIKGYYVDQLDNKGKTALIYAVDRMNVDNVKHLIKAGANVNVTYSNNQSDGKGAPLIVHLAESYGVLQNNRKQNRKQILVDIAKELVKAGIPDKDISSAATKVGPNTRLGKVLKLKQGKRK